MCFLEMFLCWFRSTSKDRKKTTGQCADIHCRYSAPVESLFLKLKIKLQEAKTKPFTKPKNVTQENLKAIKRHLMARILLNLHLISAHFPLVKGSAPHSQFPYTFPQTQPQQHFDLHQYQWRGRGRKADLSHLVHPLGHRWMCRAPLPCITVGAQHVLPLPTLLWGVQAAQLGISDSPFFPSHCPWSCHLLPHWKSRIWPAGKILLDFSFPHPNSKREFCFSRSSFHVINELKQHLFNGTSHQKKQFSSSLKTNYKPWVFQGFCCLWNTKILAIARCKLKSDLERGDEISLLIFWSKYQNAFEW